MTTPTKTLPVGDVYRAAVLMALGVPLVDGVPSKSGGRLVFVFSDENDQAKLAGASIAQDRPIPIGKFLDCLRRCRELVYQFNVTNRNSFPRQDGLL
jgi:hypothetical protein